VKEEILDLLSANDCEHLWIHISLGCQRLTHTIPFHNIN
jgi:hypothetical protein